MFNARDRDRFSNEIKALARRSGTKGVEATNQAAEWMMAANVALEDVIKPLFESYADLVRDLGRTCEIKVLPGESDTNPPRRAVAEFFIDLTEVPGVAKFFLRLETESGDWLVLTRPRLDGRGRPHETGRMMISARDKLSASIEGVLQQFIRLTY